MSEYRWIIAGPGFEGFDEDVWSGIALLVIWLSAIVVALRRMSAERNNKFGGLFWCAVAITVAIPAWLVLLSVISRI